MKGWVQIEKRRWEKNEGGIALAVRQVGGLTIDPAFGAYRNRVYLGADPSLREAQERAEKGRGKPRPSLPLTSAPEASGASKKSKPSGALKRVQSKGRALRDTPPPADKPPTAGRARLHNGSRIIVQEERNLCVPGSKRFGNYDLAKRSATVADYRAGKGGAGDLALFIERGWLKVE